MKSQRRVNWISCEDQLPPVYQRVMVRMENKTDHKSVLIVTYMRRIDADKSLFGEKQGNDVDWIIPPKYFGYKVTKWAFLPEIDKEVLEERTKEMVTIFGIDTMPEMCECCKLLDRYCCCKITRRGVLDDMNNHRRSVHCPLREVANNEKN